MGRNDIVLYTASARHELSRRNRQSTSLVTWLRGIWHFCARSEGEVVGTTTVAHGTRGQIPPGIVIRWTNRTLRYLRENTSEAELARLRYAPTWPLSGTTSQYQYSLIRFEDYARCLLRKQSCLSSPENPRTVKRRSTSEQPSVRFNGCSLVQVPNKHIPFGRCRKEGSSCYQAPNGVQMADCLTYDQLTKRDLKPEVGMMVRWPFRNDPASTVKNTKLLGPRRYGIIQEILEKGTKISVLRAVQYASLDGFQTKLERQLGSQAKV